MKIEKQLLKYKKQIENHNNRKALGWESTFDFNFGYIAALLSNKLINRKEYNILWRLYVIEQDYSDEFYEYIDKNGNLVKEKR